MATAISLNAPITANPGDEFSFVASPSSLFGSQYHTQVDGADPAVIVIGIYGPNNPNLGKARNKVGQAYVDRTLPKGVYRITVTGATAPYHIVVTTNSWWKKVWGQEASA